MTAIAVEKNITEKRDKRAKSIAAMGLVNREGDKFRVSTPSLRGKQNSYEVWRDEVGKIRCNCLEFEEAAVTDSGFRCEHILAVKYALVAKNTEPVTKQPVKVTTEIEVVSNDKRATESSDSGFGNSDLGLKDSKTIETKLEKSTDGEQKNVEKSADVSENGQAETVEANFQQLANTKGENKMLQENLKEMPFLTADEVSFEMNESPNNVLNFTSTLKELRKHVDPNLVKQREGWRDRNGNTHYVDYVEWHTVADILDENAPNWSHTVKDIRQIGGIFTVTVAITIDGVTREGIGTGTADSELGIKKAEHDALKRAAVKFGIARDLYKKESDVIERDGAVPTSTNDGGNNNNGGGFPNNPIGRSLSDLVTAKQLGMIRAIAREMTVDPDEECNNVMQCKTDELSKKAASSFIQHLQDLQKEQQAEVPMRRAG
ncbi:MAG TPA: Rad52/Rad22 family DNA repair protein [Pyrinomonadaceae bacterium]|nr:Rad52/Rad22 family DNA repair protein [Pyrinomonadaceae bacterium]